MEQVKAATDVVSGSTILATLFGWLPEVSALFALVYTLIRIYETKTIQGLVDRFKK